MTNGGTTEYANIIGGINSVDLKLTEQQELLQFQFSQKIDENEALQDSEETGNILTAGLGAFTALGTMAAVKMPIGASSAGIITKTITVPAEVISKTVIAGNGSQTAAIVLRSAAPQIARPGILGLVSGLGKIAPLLLRTLGVAGAILSAGAWIIKTVFQTFTDNAKYQIELGERTAANEVEVAAQKAQIQRMQTKVRTLEAKVQRLDAKMDVAIQKIDNIPDAVTNKLERPDGAIKKGFDGMGGKIDDVKKAVGDNFKKLFGWIPLQQIINTLAFITTMHNAAMLSSNLVQTLGSVIDVGLDVIGLKDENGESFDISEILGKKASDYMKSILGDATWTNLVNDFKKANRIYQSGMNIANSVQSMIDSTRNIMELGAENTGKIGNALRKAGVVLENAFEWMPEQINAATSKQVALNRAMNVVRELDDTASTTESVLSEVKSIQDVQKEIKEQREEWNKAVNELKAAKSTTESSSKVASESAVVTKTDLSKPVEEQN